MKNLLVLSLFLCSFVSPAQDNKVVLHQATATAKKTVPVLAGVPTVSGTLEVPNILTALRSPCSGGAIHDTWQWKRDGVNITGETASTYNLTEADYDTDITVTQTSTNALGSDNATSAAVSIVAFIDATAPLITASDVTDIFSDEFTVNTSTNELSIHYFVVVAAGSTAPTKAQIIAGVNYGAVPVVFSGSIESTNSNQVVIGLSPETSYDVYRVAVDASLNQSLIDSDLAVLTAEQPLFSNALVFLNVTSPNHHVARSGVSHTGTIVPPTGYTVSDWHIKRHTHSKTVVVHGTGNTVTHTFTFVSMDSVMVYDLVVTVTNGSQSFRRRFFAEYRVLKVAPTTFDVTWSTANAKDGSFTDRPGYRIRVTGNMSGFLNTYHWQSSDPTNPIHVVFDNATITNSGANFKMTGWRNVIFDGVTNEDVQYGLTLVKSAGGTLPLLEFQACEPNNATRVSKNVWLFGIKADGGPSPSTGATGFRILTQQTVESTNREGTYEMLNLVVAGCRVERTWEEGYYSGHANHNLNASGFAFSSFRNCLFFDIEAENIGNDAFQIGQFIDSEVFNFSLITSGTRNQSQHRNSVQLGDGNQNIQVYGGYSETAHNSLLMSNGRAGFNYEVFSNVFYSTGRDEDGSGTNGFISLINGDPATIYFGIWNNTFIVSSGALFTMFHQTGVLFNKFNATGNVFKSNTTTEREFGGGTWDIPNELLFDNLVSTNINSFGFEDQAARDYRPSSLSSALFRSSTSFTKLSPYASFDKDGYEFSDPIAGAYSGVTLQINDELEIKNISSVAALDDILDIPTGTEFADLDLPIEVLVTFNDASTRLLGITWVEGSYDGDVEDIYTLAGTLQLDPDVTNTLALTALIDVEVEDIAPPSPYSANIDIAGTTNEVGWLKTGSTEPYPGTNTNVTYNLTNSAGATNADLQVIAVNTGNVNRWNQRIAQTLTWSGSPAIPNSVMGAVWNTGSQSGSTRIGELQIVNKSGGANPLTGRTYNVKVISGRQGTGVRNNDISCQGSAPVTVDVLGNVNVVATFTGVVPTDGVISITVRYNPTGSDGSINSYVNAVVIASE